jgi:hypothetical protein
MAGEALHELGLPNGAKAIIKMKECGQGLILSVKCVSATGIAAQAVCHCSNGVTTTTAYCDEGWVDFCDTTQNPPVMTCH